MHGSGNLAAIRPVPAGRVGRKQNNAVGSWPCECPPAEQSENSTTRAGVGHVNAFRQCNPKTAQPGKLSPLCAVGLWGRVEFFNC